jgi:feruloyl esterase
MLGPELVLIHQKPAANWVTPAKMNAIRTELMRQCDKLDGLADAVINNYMACRAFFDLSEGTPNRHPWVAKRCPNNVDPNPADTSAAACLTDGQISTLEFVFTRYPFTTPLANGLKTFGMWAPTTEPSGTALANAVRYRGQEGAAADAPVHTSLGVLGVTGFLLGDPASNPLDYVEGGKWNARREQLSQWLDSTNPDLSRFYKRGGKLIVTIGTNDTVAPSGAQLDYYQSVLDKMGRQTVDSFARMYVLPQGGHGVTGNSYTVDGDGQTVKSFPLSAKFDRIAVMQDWVEKNIAPGKVVTIQGSDRTSLLCSYPSYPKYNGGPAEKAESYSCVEK